jgi:hypothetical protein
MLIMRDQGRADWFGPYMGFSHSDTVLVGHNWFLPEKAAARPASRARVPRQR